MSSMQKNPWQTKKMTVTYENPWLKIEHHEVINPKGGEGIYGVVHFKNLAIGIIPLDEDYNTWIVGQYRYPLKKYCWEIPEGGGPLDIPPLESAKRELKEEVGLKAKKWTKILDLQVSNSVTDEVAEIFVAQDLTLGVTEHEDIEEITVRKLPFSELYEMVMQGDVQDSISVASILKLKIMIDQGKF